MRGAHQAALGCAVLVATGSGCARSCGEYTHQTGLIWDLAGDDDPPAALDDYDTFEWCGAQNGSIGVRDMLGDGIAHILFDGTHRNSHVAITLTSGILRDVYFQSSAIEVGRTLSIADLRGQSDVVDSTAYHVDPSGIVSSGAWLEAGEIEFLDVKHDPFWETEAYLVRFDLTFGEPGVSEFWYTSVGEDWIAMQ